MISIIFMHDVFGWSSKVKGSWFVKAIYSYPRGSALLPELILLL